jgi:hypothetical protein
MKFLLTQANGSWEFARSARSALDHHVFLTKTVKTSKRIQLPRPAQNKNTGEPKH